MADIQKKIKKEDGVVPKKKKEMITVQLKKEIIENYEHGVRIADIARFYNKPASTICSILKKKNEIMALDVAIGITRVSKQRPRVLDDVEKLLLLWINEKQLAGENLTENLICGKAKSLYNDLMKKQPSTSTEDNESFKASKGWLENFKRRSGIQHVGKPAETAKSTEAFVAEFQELIASECYLPQQVFNCDETRLFWKRMPKRTYLTVEEKSLPGHKPMKDRLTLLLCANANGEFKIKPLLIYHSENPRAFKKCKVQKDQLDVMWRSNVAGWVTRTFFVEWINCVFGPSVTEYLLENNLPLKVLLLMDNTSAHALDLEVDLLDKYNFITVKFLPPNTTQALQPMNQGIISDFKMLYIKVLFQRCFDMTVKTSLTLREFWKNHFHIVHCIEIISKAWEEVSVRTINSAWRKLWPECIMEFLEGQELSPVDEILFLANALKLEVDEGDIQELMEEHNEELTTEELLNLLRDQQQEVVEEPSLAIEDEIKEEEEPLTTNKIREIYEKWEMIQNFVEEHHPNKAVAMRAVTLFNLNSMSHFSNILTKSQTIKEEPL